MAVVLIVEDDRIIALDFQRQLTRLGHTVLPAPPVSTAEAALAAVQTHHPGLVLMDIGLSGAQDGLTVGRAIQAMDGIAVIYLSGHVPAQLTAYAGGTGPLFYLIKPVTSEVLARTVEQVLAYVAHQHTVQALQQDVIDTLQRTHALRTSMKELPQAARQSREAVQRRRAEDAQEPPRPPDDLKEEA